MLLLLEQYLDDLRHTLDVYKERVCVHYTLTHEHLNIAAIIGDHLMVRACADSRVVASL